MNFHFIIFLSTGSFLALSACGGGGATAVATTRSYVGIFDSVSTKTSTLVSHQLDPTASTVSSTTGKYDRATNKITVSGQTGNINVSRTQVAIDSGGTIAITKGATNYVALFSAQPATGNPTLGVVGVATAPTDLLTSGTAKYVGNTTLQINDGTNIYDLYGTAAVTADFGANNVNMAFSSLNGSKTNGISAPVPVSNVAKINIDGASIVAGVFSGGTAAFSSTQIPVTLSGAQKVSTSGGLFGPSGNEVGGVFLIDDTKGSGSLNIQGSFIGH